MVLQTDVTAGAREPIQGKDACHIVDRVKMCSVYALSLPRSCLYEDLQSQLEAARVQQADLV